MRERGPGDRLRVVIAGNIYATHAVVRRFLEDDGFDVAAEALTLPELLATPHLDRADAVVVDGDLLNGTMSRLREAAPDAAIIVVTTPAATPPTGKGADGYLEKGSGLASLTALLHSLLSEAPPSPLARTWDEPRYPPQERRVLAGLAGIGAAVVVIALLSLAVFGDTGPSPSPKSSGGLGVGQRASGASETATTSGPTAIALATADLHQLLDALESGREVEAQWLLDRLQNDLMAAENAGFSISQLRSTAAQLFRPLLGDVAPRLFDELRTLPGGFLAFLITPVSSTYTTGVVGISTTETTTSAIPVDTSGNASVVSASDASGGSGGSAGSGGTGGTGGPTGTGETGGTSQMGGTDETDGTGETGGAGGESAFTETPTTTSTGNGQHYGWAHKPPTGGWHGTKPPVAGGAAADPPAWGRDKNN